MRCRISRINATLPEPSARPSQREGKVGQTLFLVAQELPFAALVPAAARGLPGQRKRTARAMPLTIGRRLRHASLTRCGKLFICPVEMSDLRFLDRLYVCARRLRVFLGTMSFMDSSFPKRSSRSFGCRIRSSRGFGMTVVPRYSVSTFTSLSRKLDSRMDLPTKLDPSGTNILRHAVTATDCQGVATSISGKST